MPTKKNKRLPRVPVMMPGGNIIRVPDRYVEKHIGYIIRRALDGRMVVFTPWSRPMGFWRGR